MSAELTRLNFLLEVEAKSFQEAFLQVVSILSVNFFKRIKHFKVPYSVQTLFILSSSSAHQQFSSLSLGINTAYF